MDDGGDQVVFSSAVCIQQSYVRVLFLNVHIYIILEFSFFVTI